MSRDAIPSGFTTCRPDSPRVGGEFELFPGEHVGKARVDLASRFAARRCLWTDTGRSALLLAAAAIRQRGGKPRAWIPAFSCESAAQPFRQAGFDLRYYAVGPGLQADGTTLPQPAPGETLLFIHYFGHRNQLMAEAAGKYRAAGVRVVEDCVQAGLMPDLAGSGDFAVTSYRKLLPVVDGAALVSDEPVDPAALGMPLAPPDEAFVSSRLIGKLLRGADADAREFLPLFESSESRLLEHIIPRRMSWASTWLMERLDWTDAVAKRRANWLVLSEAIREAKLDESRPIFDSLGADDAPLGLPLRVSGGRRDALRRFLAGRRIYCPVHWPLGHLPPSERFPEERALESCVLTLPVDQRMSAKHVDHVVAALRSFFRQE